MGLLDIVGVVRGVGEKDLGVIRGRKRNRVGTFTLHLGDLRSSGNQPDKRKPWSARSAGTKVQLHSPLLLNLSAFLEISPVHGCSARKMASVAQHAENEYVTHALRTPYCVPQPATA
jgi:hypothetical protein